MKAKLVSIGNSRGVRLPAGVIEACGFGEVLEMRVEGGVVTLAPARGQREGWDEAFKLMAESGDDRALLDEDAGTSFDDEEWTW